VALVQVNQRRFYLHTVTLSARLTYLRLVMKASRVMSLVRPKPPRQNINALRQENPNAIYSAYDSGQQVRFFEPWLFRDRLLIEVICRLESPVREDRCLLVPASSALNSIALRKFSCPGLRIYCRALTRNPFRLLRPIACWFVSVAFRCRT
jgi:hypothetical protein